MEYTNDDLRLNILPALFVRYKQLIRDAADISRQNFYFY